MLGAYHAGIPEVYEEIAKGPRGHLRHASVIEAVGEAVGEAGLVETAKVCWARIIKEMDHQAEEPRL